MIVNMLSRVVFAAYRRLPPRARYKLKTMARANGHGISHFDRLKGWRDAQGKKRLDRSMRKVIESLSKAGIETLEGASCLEVGAGFVPSDTLCFYLLGAKAATATDYNRILQVEALIRAVVCADNQALEAAAASLTDRAGFRQRLDRLHRACSSGSNMLKELDIEYLAPVDLSQKRLGRAQYDLIYSISVFEHVPLGAVDALLRNLVVSLSPTGCMLHEIHLEDHLDMENDPFGFLRRDSGYSIENDTDARGNRIRFGHWEQIFRDLPGARTEFVGRSIRMDCRPEIDTLLPEYALLDADDCFTALLLAKTTLVQSKPNC